ncbi:FMN-dependent NADH-azoreductase [uncultured archaeon]|nr:FMN-dependent NADH-azoreductase [uncultured archaeon]
MNNDSIPASAGSEPASLPSVCVIYAYPSNTAGHGRQLLQTVQRVLSEAGASVELIDLYRENFNPVTSEEEHALYAKGVPPDVAALQSRLSACEVWIFLYPVWWSTPPAMLKGFIDRVLTPGFAFRYEKHELRPLLSSKRALVIRTFGGSALSEQKIGEVASNFMDKAVLGACGLKVSSQDIYSVESLAETAFNHALFQASGATRRMLSRPTGVPHYLRSISAPYLPPIEQRPKLPVDSEGEEKPELSEEAKADLDYFRSARRKAREAVHERADHMGIRTANSGSSGRRDSRGGRERGSFGGGRGSNERGSFGSRSGQNQGNRSGSRTGGIPFSGGSSRSGGFSGSPGSNSGSPGGRSPQGGGQFFGRKSQENRRPESGPRPFGQGGGRRHKRRRR